MTPFYTYFYSPIAKNATVVYTDVNGNTTKPRAIGKYSNREAANKAFDEHYKKAVRVAEIAGRVIPTKHVG